MGFDGEWARIRSAIRPGIKIRNWTVDHGYIGEDFVIGNVTDTGIEIAEPDVRVSKGDFTIVWQLWPSYLARTLRRSKMSPLTRRSKYVISILHFVSNDSERHRHDHWH
jgi:hypothetical protein